MSPDRIIVDGELRVAMPDGGDLFFGAKLEAWELKMFQFFYFLQPDMVFGIFLEPFFE